MVDCLGIAVLNAQDELDLFEGTAVDVEQRLHEDRHDALSDLISALIHELFFVSAAHREKVPQRQDWNTKVEAPKDGKLSIIPS